MIERPILFVAFAVLLSACTAPDDTRRTLSDAGYTDIEVGGFAPFFCGRDDVFATQFTATNPLGNRVRGAVCCGWMKGCTVRF